VFCFICAGLFTSQANHESTVPFVLSCNSNFQNLIYRSHGVVLLNALYSVIKNSEFGCSKFVSSCHIMIVNFSGLKGEREPAKRGSRENNSITVNVIDCASIGASANIVPCCLHFEGLIHFEKSEMFS